MVLRQGMGEFRQRRVSIGGMHDQLGDHRVVVDTDKIAATHPGVDAHAGAVFRQFEIKNPARGRHEVALRRFSIDARLDGVALAADFGLPERQRLTRGDAQLPLDQILPGDHFGDRVLDLQAGVHFHEVKAAVLVQQELDRTGADIVDRPGAIGRRGTHALPQIRAEPRRGRLFEDFLMAALDRTVALEQVHAITLGIGEDLQFDVARPGQVAFDQYLVVAETGAGLASRRNQRGRKLLRVLDQAHALAPAAGAGLDQLRVTDAFGFLTEPGVILVRIMITGHQRHPGLRH